MNTRRKTPGMPLLLLLMLVAERGHSQTLLLDPEPRTCRVQDVSSAVSVISPRQRNAYPAGGVLMVLAQVSAGLFGSLEVDLCPEGNINDACLDRVPLQLADGSGSRFNLQKVNRTDKYEIPVILPNDIICSTCVLQLRVLSRPCQDSEVCPQTETIFCTDIAVRDIRKPREKRQRYSKYLKNLGTCLTCVGNMLETVEDKAIKAFKNIGKTVLDDVCKRFRNKCKKN